MTLYSVLSLATGLLNPSWDMNLNSTSIYTIRQSTQPRYEDAVLALIPGAPLLIAQNINSSLGDLPFPFLFRISAHDHIGLVNGALVEFYGFVGAKNLLGDDDRIFRPPQYMLVKI
jgi:hypothetical protein